MHVQNLLYRKLMNGSGQNAYNLEKIINSLTDHCDKYQRPENPKQKQCSKADKNNALNNKTGYNNRKTNNGSEQAQVYIGNFTYNFISNVRQYVWSRFLIKNLFSPWIEYCPRMLCNAEVMPCSQ